MKVYVGIKVVQAAPAKTVNGCIWPEDLPLPVNPEPVRGHEDECCCRKPYADRCSIEEVYVYDGGNGYPVVVPKEEFEKEFFPAENLTFSVALDALKRGERIARKGWNGKGMYVFLASEVEFHTMADISEFAEKEDGVYTSDMMVLRTAQGTFQPGWLATQSDILAEDWYVLGRSHE